MKQFISLITLLLVLLAWYSVWDIYGAKNYQSEYLTKKKTDQVDIKEMSLDKEQINKLSKNIKGLKQDPVFRLKINDFTTTIGQPLFKEQYDSLFEKIVKQNQMSNRPN